MVNLSGPLSPAQKRVADLVAAGLSNQQIARKLFLSPHTVHSHVRVIEKKMGATNRAQIALKLRVPDQSSLSNAIMSATGLTPRQRKVGSLLAQGLTRKEVAARSGVPFWAVKKDASALQRALGTGSALGMILRLLQQPKKK